THAFAVASAKEAANGLAGCLTEQIPKGNIYSADGMSDGAAASEPKGVLVQFFADALRFECVLTAIERLQNGQCRTNKLVVAENAAQADKAFICVNCDECVDAVFWLELVAPAAFRSGAA